VAFFASAKSSKTTGAQIPMNCLSIPEFNKELKHMSQPNFIVDKRLKPNPIKARISHRNSVPFRYLNTMIILPKYNSPSSDVVSSNAPPLHRDGSHPIGGFLLGVLLWHL
jgi:hypothetical protein